MMCPNPKRRKKSKQNHAPNRKSEKNQTGRNRREISVVHATGYNTDIRVIRHKYYIRGIKARGYLQISVVYNHGILARILAHPMNTLA